MVSVLLFLLTARRQAGDPLSALVGSSGNAVSLGTMNPLDSPNVKNSAHASGIRIARAGDIDAVVDTVTSAFLEDPLWATPGPLSPRIQKRQQSGIRRARRS